MLLKGDVSRFVNHRDAWTFGAVDPNSGTASLLEVLFLQRTYLKRQGSRFHESNIYIHI